MKTMIAVAMLAVLAASGHAEPEAEPQDDGGVPAIGEAGAVDVPVFADASGMVLARNEEDPDVAFLRARMQAARRKLWREGQIQKSRSTWQTNKNGDRVCAEQADYVQAYMQGKEISGYHNPKSTAELRALMSHKGKLPRGYDVQRVQNRNIVSYIPLPQAKQREVEHRWLEVKTPKNKYVTLDPWANRAFAGQAPPNYARTDWKTRATTVRERIPPVDLPVLNAPPRRHY